MSRKAQKKKANTSANSSSNDYSIITIDDNTTEPNNTSNSTIVSKLTPQNQQLTMKLAETYEFKITKDSLLALIDLSATEHERNFYSNAYKSHLASNANIPQYIAPNDENYGI